MKQALSSQLIWITGFSGSGKSTIAKLLKEALLNEAKITPIILDGDELRLAFDKTGELTYSQRLSLAYMYSKLAKLLCDQGFVVIVATISMFEQVRTWNRENNKNYFEIYLKISEEERKKRDPKKLYASGQEMVSPLHGYDEPANADLVLQDSDCKDASEVVKRILFKIGI